MNIDCCKSYVGKQVIGLLPSEGGEPPEAPCFYFGEYSSPPDNDFSFWTIGGQPFNTQLPLITGNASNSINNNASPIIIDTRFAWALTNDVTSLPTLPIALDSFGNPFTATWVQGGCKTTCYELLVPKTDLLFSQLFLGLSSGVVLDRAGFGISNWDISSPAIVSIIDTYWRSAVGPQASVTSTLDANGDYIVRINNTYENFAPYWSNQSLGLQYFNEVTC